MLTVKADGVGIESRIGAAALLRRKFAVAIAKDLK